MIFDNIIVTASFNLTDVFTSAELEAASNLAEKEDKSVTEIIDILLKYKGFEPTTKTIDYF